MKGIGDTVEWTDMVQGPEARDSIEVPEWEVTFRGEIVDILKQKLSFKRLRSTIEAARGRKFKMYGRTYRDRVDYDRFLVVATIYRENEKVADDALVLVRCSIVDPQHHDKVLRRFEKARARKMENQGSSRRNSAGGLRIVRGARRMSDNDRSDFG